LQGSFGRPHLAPEFEWPHQMAFGSAVVRLAAEGTLRVLRRKLRAIGDDIRKGEVVPGAEDLARLSAAADEGAEVCLCQ
jgi:hypothetical protein